MDLVDTAKLIIWINQFDPYVQANDASRDIWAHSMAPLEYGEAEEAVVQHYRQNPGTKAEPGTILKRALQNRSSREAGNRAMAIEPAPTPSQQNAQDGNLFRSWRQRNPEEWDRLVKQSAEDRKQHLIARGLPWQFPGPAHQ